MKPGISGLAVSKRQPLREEVYEALKRAILRGKLPSGERLIEEELASLLGTSRTPVREAIHKLEKDDLVVRLQRGGFAVRQFTVEDVEEIFGIRSVLESHAAALATRHINAETIQALAKKIEKSRERQAAGDLEALIRLNTQFHDTLYRAAKSKRLYDMINEFRDYFLRYRVAILSVDGMSDISIRDHFDMLEAMNLKDETRVEQLVRRHILRGKDVVIEQVKKTKVQV